VAYDRLTGWTASAVSPQELAGLILQAYGNRPMPAGLRPPPVLLSGLNARPAAFPHPDAA
jgi:hypothetical protein